MSNPPVSCKWTHNKAHIKLPAGYATWYQFFQEKGISEDLEQTKSWLVTKVNSLFTQGDHLE